QISEAASQHLFLWDSTADVIARGHVLVRITASDATATGHPLIFSVGEMGRDVDTTSGNFNTLWSFPFGEQYQRGTLTRARPRTGDLEAVLALRASGDLAVILPENLGLSPPSGL